DEAARPGARVDSGLLGLADTSDMVTVLANADGGAPALALEVYPHRLRAAIAAVGARDGAMISRHHERNYKTAYQDRVKASDRDPRLQERRAKAATSTVRHGIVRPWSTRRSRRKLAMVITKGPSNAWSV
ncbi:MAG: hypothetical protein ACREQM_01645, partial [Candidatus Dormibacteraceae bacterium]